jgi:4-alpha-glucanotransferase
MKRERQSGILLHPTSLPCAHGVGDMGACARNFVNALHQAGQRWWQMLPLGPTGMGNSPYNAHSAFAGSPLLISLDDLVRDHFLTPEDIAAAPTFSGDRVHFDEARRFKTECFRVAYHRAQNDPAFETFCRRQKSWLETYALYSALKERNHGRAWVEWTETQVDDDVQREARFHKFVQFLFFRQWDALKVYAHKKGVSLFGDVPIYVAHDSADVWANRKLFYLRPDGRPSDVAGTPPDYFSKTGQWWGNPLYRWSVHRKMRYAWWRARLTHQLKLFDLIRLDHFIGFQRFWKINARHKNAAGGRWVKGPGRHFFERALSPHERARIIAEDLGVLGPDVEELRDRFHFPGMKVLQFSFGDERLPDFPERSVIYTGTHDNDTTVGWFRKCNPHDRHKILHLLNGKPATIHWDMIRAAMASNSFLAVVPAQDVLGLSSKARMNTPGVGEGNWSWRLSEEMKPRTLKRLRAITHEYGRN